MLQTLLIGIVAVALGLLVAFAGYPLFRLILPFVGLIVGFMVGTTVLSSWLFGVIIGIGLAIVFAVGAYAIWGYLIGFAGAIIGMAVGANLAMALHLGGLLTLILAVVVGAGFLVLAYMLKDAAVLVWTAAAGGSMVAYGAAVLLPGIFGQPGSYGFLYYVVWILAGLLGFFVQYRAFKDSGMYGDKLIPSPRQLV